MLDVYDNVGDVVAAYLLVATQNIFFQDLKTCEIS